MPEIDQELSKSSKKKIKISFTPHLIPTFRGILSTIYLDLPKGIKIKKVKDCLLNFYKKEKFVNVVNSKEMINTNRVLNTNNCNIAVYQTRFDSQIIIASSLDNLIKGAAGQAVQNFNIRFGFKETLSLV
jgi:N-acetyl-gamma-glutamyl-phosphate reductase